MKRLKALKLSPSAWVGLVLLAVFVLLGLFGPWIAPCGGGVLDDGG